MKSSIFNQKNVCALLGVILALTIVMSASAQGGMMPNRNISSLISDLNESTVQEELVFEEVVIDIQEIASVTFINKEGMVVAILEGDKSVLEDIYRDKISKSYYMSSYGIHEVYLIK